VLFDRLPYPPRVRPSYTHGTVAVKGSHAVGPMHDIYIHTLGGRCEFGQSRRAPRSRWIGQQHADRPSVLVREAGRASTAVHLDLAGFRGVVGMHAADWSRTNSVSQKWTLMDTTPTVY
jgi:hypothetical protein